MGIRGRLLAVVFAAIVPQLFFLFIWLKSDRNFGIYLIVALAGGLCSALVASLVVRKALRRWGLLESAAQQLGEGNYAARVQIDGQDDISRIACAFNRMAEKLEEREHRFTELDELKSEFVSRVSHELRTPLTTIKALTRLLIRQDLTDEKQREYLETISGECDRQIELVLNLLDLSRIEGGVYRLSLKRVELAEVAAVCVKTEIN
ncbi:MAG: histidine kinase dimerization/phospho-acceptor domain-containing protein, partial [Microcoleus sp.]